MKSISGEARRPNRFSWIRIFLTGVETREKGRSIIVIALLMGVLFFLLPPASVQGTQWGTSGDVPVPGDYDGDGIRDFAVWRPGSGYWYILRSSDGGITSWQWGLGSASDVPVPGDYDGDGKTDCAVWRQNTGFWYVLQSSNGVTTGTQWGSNAVNDVPVPGDYNKDGKTDIAVWRPGDGMWYILIRDEDGIVPHPGEWEGSIIKFYVSPDSSKLTASGSTLKRSDGSPTLLIIGPVSFSGACSGTVTMYSGVSEIPISNLSWSYNSSAWDISGTFTASNMGNGSYSFSTYDTSCGGNIHGSGTWVAAPTVPSSTSNESVNELPDQIVDLHDPVTGEVIGIMEFVYD